MKVFISTTTFGEYDKESINLLKRKSISYSINPYKRKLNEEEILGILQNNLYIGLIAGTEPLTKKVLENARSLKVISRVGVGLDNIDLMTANKLNIKVFNTPNVLTDAVAEMTIGLILCCLRKITSVDRNIRNKIWKKEMGSLFKGKILGIIGFGRIGKRVAKLAKTFGAKVIFYDVKSIKSKLFKQVYLAKLLKDSDIISIHTSAKDTLITRKEITKMKNNVIIINTSRGSVIDEDDLYNGLKSGKISFAGLDVFTDEPYTGGMINLDNIVLTPHISSYAKEARIKMETEAVKNLLKGFQFG